MSGQRLLALSLALAAVMHSLSSGRWIGSSAVLLALVARVILPHRLVVSTFVEVLLTLVCAASGGTLAWLEAPDALPRAALGQGFSAVAIAALAGGALRLFLREPKGGPFATFVFGVAAMVAAGETRTGPVYPAFVVAYVLCGLAALRATDDGRPRLSELPARGWGTSAFALSIAVALSVLLSLVLPPLGQRAKDKLLSSLGEPTTGLGERLVLGSMDGMQQSEEIVARVYGPPVDYLRGVVYDHYQAGQWAASTTDGTRSVKTLSSASSGPARVRVMLLSAARTDRYLLPLGAKSIAIPDGPVLVDRFGSVRPERGSPKWIELDAPEEREGETPPPGDFAAVDPGQDDLRRPVKLSREITPLVRSWTEGKTTPEDRVSAIASHLREDYKYSIQYERGAGDPLLDFFFEHREGHCEYFASAMAMAARTAGIPSRVVAGYRVTEHNDLGGYSIVRQRDAHAWVEVYLTGRGWTKVDATPPDRSGQARRSRTPWGAALLDLLAARWTDLFAKAEAPSLLEIASALFVFVLAGLAIRWWTNRNKQKAQALDSFFASDAPPPALVRLERALVLLDRARGPAETLDAFAARLTEHQGSEAAQQAGDLLRKYAALKYGGEGDAETLWAEMDALTARLGSR